MKYDINWVAIDRSDKVFRAWGMRNADAICQHTGQTGADLAATLNEWTGAGSATAIVSGDKTAECRPLPARPSDLPLQPGIEIAAGIETRLVPGLSQADPDDRAHGPETRIAGFLSMNPGWDGVICLPGARTRWAMISADEIVRMQPFATLPVRDAAAQALGIAGTAQDWNAEVFGAAVSDTMSRPEALAARLANLDGDHAAARLSGHLIGAELAAARPWWLGQQLAVIGPAGDARLYSAALTQQGTPVLETDESKMTLAGLKVFRKRQAETGA